MLHRHQSFGLSRVDFAVSFQNKRVNNRFVRDRSNVRVVSQLRQVATLHPTHVRL